MRIRSAWLLAAAAMLSVATPAVAATISTIEGDVLVNTGRGFVRALVGQEIKPGDRVMVGPRGGNATVSYGLSCFERVPVGSVITVKTGVPCQNPGTTTQPSPLGNVPTTTILLGGAAAIGGGILIYQATKSTSP